MKTGKTSKSKTVKSDDMDTTDEVKISKIIEDLKKQLLHLVKNKGLQDEAVIELSQKLDKYIVLAQRNMKKYSRR
jgi:hypothetical protein